MAKHWDVIVIGAGAMGAATALHLARRGARVLVLERFERGHDRGSSHGGSRVVRETYFESPDYVPLVRRSMAQFAELEELTRERLLHRCGVLYAGDPQGEVIRGVRASAAMHGIPLDAMSPEQCRRRFPCVAVPTGLEALFEPGAGFVRPERTVRAMLRLAEGHGAVVLEGERVERLDEGPRLVAVESEADQYEADRVVVAAGAWCSALLPTLRRHARATRQTIAWIEPRAGAAAGHARVCPVWFIEDGTNGPFYGIPIEDEQEPPLGVKVARHVPGANIDPDAPREPVSDAERLDLEDAMRRLVPGAAGPASAVTTCLYTMSPDEHFIVDRAPGLRRVFVACGFSGHGFKFAPVIGEIMADLALEGSTALPCGFLRWSRFGHRSTADPAEHP